MTLCTFAPSITSTASPHHEPRCLRQPRGCANHSLADCAGTNPSIIFIASSCRRTARSGLAMLPARRVQFGRHGRAAIFDDRHQIAEIAGVAHGRFHALVGIDADHEQRLDSQIIQHVMEVCRRKYAAGGLIDHDLIPIVQRRDDFQEIRVTGTRRRQQPSRRWPLLRSRPSRVND